jgi:hypothetical protein
MAHLHLIEDIKNQLIDVKNYCSDSCNFYDNEYNYQGWNGCNEISLTQKCNRESCKNIIKGVENE